MSLRDFARSLRPGNDQQLTADLSAQRRAQHRARVQRDGDNAGRPFPRRLFRNNG